MTDERWIEKVCVLVPVDKQSVTSSVNEHRREEKEKLIVVFSQY